MGSLQIMGHNLAAEQNSNIRSLCCMRDHTNYHEADKVVVILKEEIYDCFVTFYKYFIKI